MTDDIALAILAELRGLRAELRRQASATSDHADLLHEIEADLGPAPFTSSGLLQLAEDYPAGSLAAVLRRVVNIDDPSAAIQLGRLLARMQGIVAVGDRRGARLFRVTSTETNGL